ncbi:hypothetical protein PVAP13_6NG164603 [Panicum virgatum]|uniref:Uncharacterized protein n=1 Tax=Panicum virgatum TaxID=38727 RepID=A0A8T0QZQ2_PANVG|nr:hypothetical protein PVAP13_6NG164603 [Panicum virgatum]
MHITNIWFFFTLSFVFLIVNFLYGQNWYKHLCLQYLSDMVPMISPFLWHHCSVYDRAMN